jgi:heme A synthase
MRNVYRALAFAVAGLVAVQAASIAYAVFGLAAYIDGGGAVDKNSDGFPGVGGLMAHGIGGQLVIPLVTLALLVVSFFAHVAGGVRWALIVLGTVAVQVALGIFSHSLPALGAVHGLVAMVLFGVAVTAAMRARGTARRTAEPARVSTPVA